MDTERRCTSHRELWHEPGVRVRASRLRAKEKEGNCFVLVEACVRVCEIVHGVHVYVCEFVCVWKGE